MTVRAQGVDLVRDQVQVPLFAELCVGEERFAGVCPSQWVLRVRDDL